jgi:NADH-quinone oxidoreductase subunit I
MPVDYAMDASRRLRLRRNDDHNRKRQHVSRPVDDEDDQVTPFRRAGRRARIGRVIGSGLARGLGVTLRNLTRRSVTAQYPDVKPALPPRSRGVIALLEENCTVCMLCARECPDWCIYIDSHKEVVPAATEGAKDRSYNMLDRFAIDFALCMYCGICIEVCPFDALFWSPEFEYAEFDIRDLTHEKDRLGEWMHTVPPPAPFDVRAEPAKEFVAAQASTGAPAATPGPAPDRRSARSLRPAPPRPTPPPDPER